MKRTHRYLLPLLLVFALLLAGCGEKSAAHADLQAVYDKIGSSLELPEMLPLSEKNLENYYGIDTAACKQLIAAVCDDGLRVDEIWLIETGSEKEAEALLTLAKSRIGQVCAETENYLPDQYAVAKNAQALRIGASVALFISPDAKEMADIFTKAFQ